MNGWKRVKLGDVAGVQNGYAFKSKDFSDKGVPVIKIKNMSSGSIFFDVFWDKSIKKLNKYVLKKGDILVSMTGSHLSQRNSAVGKITKYNSDIKGLLNQRVGKIYPKNEDVDQKFLYYTLTLSSAQKYWAERAGGTANQANISPTIIKALPLNLPSKGMQEEIAELVSNYDDLIENNKKRIKILEEMAQRLYAEWFVKFKFPGYESVKMVDSETEFGMIPEGWEVKTVNDSFKFLGGGTPSKKVDAYWLNGGIEWFTPSDLTKTKRMFAQSSSLKINEFGLKNSSAKLFPSKSVMMTSRATIGVVAINSKEATTNQGFITCLPNEDVGIYFLYFWLKDNKKLFIELGTGATFKEISKTRFKTVKIMIPNRRLMQSFESLASFYGNEIENLQKHSINITQIRDLLIENLVTGKRKLKN